jgi:hypothetical protein
MESDVMLYVVGSADENEVLLYRYGLVWHVSSRTQLIVPSVVLALRDSLNILLKYAYSNLASWPV